MKEVKKLIKELEREGWVKVSQNKHIKMRHPTITGIIIVPSSPRCPHWEKNLRKQIQRQSKVAA
jgi:predicted RNA binding protein YcfA (HicA-like mRNA interferase family)